jgi:D-glycerate 3-kinase
LGFDLRKKLRFLSQPLPNLSPILSNGSVTEDAQSIPSALTADAATVSDVLECAGPRLETWLAAEALGDSVRSALASVHVPLALWLASQRGRRADPLICGIAGGQGSGKSSLAALLALLLEHGLGLRVAVLSLDDLYLTRSERERLAAEVHPLLATRGLPGSHDVALGSSVLDSLCAAGTNAVVSCPRFDKARDERAPASEWPKRRGPIDIVLFEGWCLGAEPETAAALDIPINDFERERDPDASYRRYVDAQLAGPYRQLFARLDLLVFLAVPDMASVRRWRTEQENKLAAREAAAPGLMSPAELESFVQRFERITRRMLAQTPERARIVLRLGVDHGVRAVELRAD